MSGFPVDFWVGIAAGLVFGAMFFVVTWKAPRGVSIALAALNCVAVILVIAFLPLKGYGLVMAQGLMCFGQGTGVVVRNESQSGRTARPAVNVSLPDSQ